MKMADALETKEAALINFWKRSVDWLVELIIKSEKQEDVSNNSLNAINMQENGRFRRDRIYGNCGAEVNAKSQFCNHCGKRVK